LPARSARQIATPGSGDVVRVGAVAILPAANNGAPTGSLVLSYRKSHIRVTEAGVPVLPAGKSFRVYVEASDSVRSGIAIANTSGNTAPVRIELMDLNGASLAVTTVTLAPYAQLARFLSEIPGLQSLSLPVQGLLRITSASPITIIGLRSRTNERG